MKNSSVNPINERIVNEICVGLNNIEKQEVEERKKHKEKGNWVAMILRKYILSILNYYGLDYKVSNVNAYIKNCPIEWDLIILRKDAVDKYETNVYEIDDCICLLEFKTGGVNHVAHDSFKIEEKLKKDNDGRFEYLDGIKQKLGITVPFGYVSFAEDPYYYNVIKKYFDGNNELASTVFVFTDYDSYYKKHEIKYIMEFNNFEEYLLELLNKYNNKGRNE